MDWFFAHSGDVLLLTAEHLILCAMAVGIAVLVAVPLGLWAHGNGMRLTWLTAATGILYTVPSLALFALLVPVVGLGQLPVVVGLVVYCQLILIRAVVSGLDSVPDDVRDAALGMGISRWEILRSVDFPLALPVFFAGLRMAVVTVIGIATIGAVVDAGGLGTLILQGIQRDFPAQVVTGALAVTVVAIAADASLLRLERRLQPWSKVAG